MDYKSSGVNIAAGEEAVQRIKGHVKKTFNKNVLAEIGSFGGLYQLDLEKWKKPVMVSSTDGVGTKLIVAKMAGVYDTIGQDLANHCVNDILVQGAVPQFFMDYIGCDKLDPVKVEKVISGMTKACIENEMSLIGGEMAEMPGIYSEDDIDLVGTIVGLVEKDRLITGEKIVEGDVVLGLIGNGLHTNGYSLARKIFFEKMGKRVDDYLSELGMTVGEALLKIHPSYYSILRNHLDPNVIHGMAHITGGGIPGNLKRVLPKELEAQINVKSWEIPEVFQLMQKESGIKIEEAFRAFNMGIGFIIVVEKSNSKALMDEINAIKIGEIAKKTQSEGVLLIF